MGICENTIGIIKQNSWTKKTQTWNEVILEDINTPIDNKRFWWRHSERSEVVTSHPEVSSKSTKMSFLLMRKPIYGTICHISGYCTVIYGYLWDTLPYSEMIYDCSVNRGHNYFITILLWFMIHMFRANHNYLVLISGKLMQALPIFTPQFTSRDFLNLFPSTSSLWDRFTPMFRLLAPGKLYGNLTWWLRFSMCKHEKKRFVANRGCFSCGVGYES